ncbi:hypothetical protein [Hydrogenophaga sp. MI9]|uniref:hypothetical protein n=1 Tax=Hydrogenophaga sp. MI9 TaxID=3453719 RepID=UPI003EECE819
MRNSRLLWFIAGALTVALAVVLNPSPERHRASIKERIAQRSQLAEILHLGDLVAFVSSYHSLGVASYTVVNDRTLSVGALGMVFVLDQGAAK